MSARAFVAGDRHRPGVQLQRDPRVGQLPVARRGRVAGGHAGRRQVQRDRVGTRARGRERAQSGQAHVDGRGVGRGPERQERQSVSDGQARRGPLRTTRQGRPVRPVHADRRSQVVDVRRRRRRRRDDRPIQEPSWRPPQSVGKQVRDRGDFRVVRHVPREIGRFFFTPPSVTDLADRPYSAFFFFFVFYPDRVYAFKTSGLGFLIDRDDRKIKKYLRIGITFYPTDFYTLS